jgi:hypothetical protein
MADRWRGELVHVGLLLRVEGRKFSRSHVLGKTLSPRILSSSFLSTRLGEILAVSSPTSEGPLILFEMSRNES